MNKPIRRRLDASAVIDSATLQLYLTGGSSRNPVPGSLVVVTADLVGPTVFAPIELPCGLITAAVGAPFFVFLLWQQRKQV